MSQIVDTRGKVCPLPLIMLRQAIRQSPNEKIFEIYTDNEISCSNLIDFIQHNGYRLSKDDRGDYTCLSIDITSQTVSRDSHTFSPSTQSGIRVVQLRSNVMGEGDTQLGEALLLAYLQTLTEIDIIPTHVVCYNSGALLCGKEHEAVSLLKAIHDKGAEILVCGVCADYYNVKDHLGIGTISNMLTISNLLAQADTIVTP